MIDAVNFTLDKFYTLRIDYGIAYEETGAYWHKMQVGTVFRLRIYDKRNNETIATKYLVYYIGTFSLVLFKSNNPLFKKLC